MRLTNQRKEKVTELNINEINFVSGGDAAATREPGQNSRGEWPAPTEKRYLVYIFEVPWN